MKRAQRQPARSRRRRRRPRRAGRWLPWAVVAGLMAAVLVAGLVAWRSTDDEATLAERALRIVERLGGPATDAVMLAGLPGEIQARFLTADGEDTAAFLRLLEAAADEAARQHARVAVVTGGYTDPRGAIVGYALRDGVVLQPRSAAMDGFVRISPQGRLAIQTLAEVQLPKSQAVAEVPSALQQHSGFQTHLIVDQGANQVAPGAPDARARRRALVEAGDGQLLLVDSGDAVLSLRDWAAQLIEGHQARRAANLDMGTYNVCILRPLALAQGCGHIGENVRLSNAVVLGR